MDVSTLPCPICGQINYEIGQVSWDVVKPLYLYKYKAAVGQKFRDLLKIHSPKNSILAARRCLICQNVQLFMEIPNG